MKAASIFVDGTVVFWDLADRDDERYRQVRAVVGGYVEACRIGDDAYLLIDEEGRLKDRVPNLLASALYGLDSIVGDAVMIGNDGGPEFVGLTEEWIATLSEFTV